jgi:hypothetical protein
MDPFAAMLADARRTGVYQVRENATEVVRAAQAAGLACFRIDLVRVRAKEEFLDSVSTAMRFPDWFGHNWDALADCLQDLSWIGDSGWVLLLENGGAFSEGRQGEFAAAMELMAGAAQFWRKRGKPFWTLIAGHGGWDPGYPPLFAA